MARANLIYSAYHHHDTQLTYQVLGGEAHDLRLQECLGVGNVALEQVLGQELLLALVVLSKAVQLALVFSLGLVGVLLLLPQLILKLSVEARKR